MMIAYYLKSLVSRIRAWAFLSGAVVETLYVDEEAGRLVLKVWLVEGEPTQYRELRVRWVDGAVRVEVARFLGWGATLLDEGGDVDDDVWEVFDQALDGSYTV